MEQEANQLEGTPPSPTFLTLVLKTFAGLGGGIAGTLILLMIFLGASSILQPSLNPDISAAGEISSKNPLFIFVFMAMIFLTSIGSNLLGSLFFTFVEHEKYSRTSTALYQIFAVNLVIFTLLAPLYILLDSRNLLQMIGFLAAFHVMISALASAIILEIIGNLRYALVGVYGVVFSLVISAAITLTIYQFSRPVIVLFATLPVIWMTLGFVTTISTMLYRWIWSLYGKDFLMSTTDYGRDYGEQEVEEAPPPPDVSGADFLSKK